MLFKPSGFIFSGCFLNVSVECGFSLMVLVLFGLVSVFNKLPCVHGDPGLFGLGGFCGGSLFGSLLHGIGEGCPFAVNVCLWVCGLLGYLWRG